MAMVRQCVPSAAAWDLWLGLHSLHGVKTQVATIFVLMYRTKSIICHVSVRTLHTISPYTGRGWPLNHHFVFDLTAVGTLIVAAVSLLLPKSIEMKRVRKPKDTSEQTTMDDSEDINQERTQQQS